MSQKKNIKKYSPKKSLYSFTNFLFFEKNLGENFNILKNNIISVEAAKVLQYCHLGFGTGVFLSILCYLPNNLVSLESSWFTFGHVNPMVVCSQLGYYWSHPIPFSFFKIVGHIFRMNSTTINYLNVVAHGTKLVHNKQTNIV
jgi:hypothetical protein